MEVLNRLPVEMIEQLAKEIRDYLLDNSMWVDVNIYFNGKCYSTYDKESGRYFYNDRENLVEREDDPRNYFEYVAEDHVLSMSFDGALCEVLYYGEYPALKRGLDKIFEKYGLYYEFGHHWNLTCYYI